MKRKYISINPQCERCASFWGEVACCHDPYTSEDEKEGRIPCEMFTEIDDYTNYNDDDDYE